MEDQVTKQTTWLVLYSSFGVKLASKLSVQTLNLIRELLIPLDGIKYLGGERQFEAKIVV